MRSTSNPAFRNLPVGGGGYAGFNSATTDFPGAQPGYAGAPPITARPMTVDDVVTKTSITLAVLAATGAVTYLSGLWGLALPAALIGFVLALVVIFKKVVSPPLILAYAAVEGVFLGGISGVIGTAVGNPGIILQAITGTALVFGGMLVVYKTGAVKVMASGLDFEFTQFDLAVQGRRNPGSAFKVFGLSGLTFLFILSQIPFVGRQARLAQLAAKPSGTGD